MSDEPASSEAPESVEVIDVQPTPAKPPAGGRVLALLALLLALAAVAGSAWVWWSGQQVRSDETLVSDRVTALQGQMEQLRAELAASSDRFSPLDQALSELQAESARLAPALGALQQRIAPLDQRLDSGLARLDYIDRSLQSQAEQLQVLAGADRRAWQVEEVGHLLRLASRSLLLGRDPETAIGLLESVDAILRDLDDGSGHALRAAVADDLAVLRALPRTDVAGSYLRLDALRDQVAGLVLPGTDPRLQVSAAAADEQLPAWRRALQRVWLRIQEFVVIRRREAPAEPLLPPAEEQYLRQNIGLSLNQAQLALLQQREDVYRVALERVASWLSDWFDADDPAVQAFVAELQELASLPVAAQMPELSASMQAYRGFRAARQGGSGAAG